MPKAKITHTTPAVSASARRTPVKVNSSGTPIWYKILMFGLILFGFGWLIVNYLAGPSIQLMTELGPWNYLIGFGAFILGLLMTMAWR